MQNGKESGIVEWIGMFISVLVFLFLSLRGRKAIQPEGEETEEHRPVRRSRHHEELDDEDEEEPEVRHILTPSQTSQTRATKQSMNIQAYVKRNRERALSANYRLKNALEGFQLRSPIDQKRAANAIEQRTLGTMQLSEFLQVDPIKEAEEKARELQQRTEAEAARARLREGMIWSQVLQLPLALRKGSELS